MKTNTKGLEVKTLQILPVWNLNIIKKNTSPYLQFKYHYTMNLSEIFQVLTVFWVWQ